MIYVFITKFSLIHLPHDYIQYYNEIISTALKKSRTKNNQLIVILGMSAYSVDLNTSLEIVLQKH